MPPLARRHSAMALSKKRKMAPQITKCRSNVLYLSFGVHRLLHLSKILLELVQGVLGLLRVLNEEQILLLQCLVLFFEYQSNNQTTVFFVYRAHGAGKAPTRKEGERGGGVEFCASWPQEHRLSVCFFVEERGDTLRVMDGGNNVESSGMLYAASTACQRSVHLA